MEYAFTLNVLPVVGGVVIVLVLVLCELGSTGFGGGLPSGGYRYYIGEHTVLYLRQSGTRCRAYVLEGEAPPAVPLHHSRGGTYFKVWAASPAEAELEIEQAYQRLPGLSQLGARRQSGTVGPPPTTERNPLWQSSGNWSGGSRPWAQ